MVDKDLKLMIFDYMDNGFLENIIDMFKADISLFALIPEMIKHEGMRVRIGTVALVEELSKDFQSQLKTILKDIASLLDDANATLRGDAVTILGYIYDIEAVSYVKKAMCDSDKFVREIAQETLTGLQEKLNIDC